MKNSISGTVKHLPRLYILSAMLVTVTLILLMFPRQKQSTHYNYAVGSFWSDNDLYAEYDFAIVKSQSEIDKELIEAKSKSLLYYQQDSSAHLTARTRLAQSSLSRAEQQKLRHTIDSIYQRGYIELPADIADIQNHTIVLLTGNIGSEHRASEYVSADDIQNDFLVDSILVPSIVFDANRTQLELDSRMSQSSYTSDMVHTGELIIAKGEYVTEEKAQVIRSLEAQNDERFDSHYDLFGHLVGQFMLCIIAFVALYMFMKNTNHPILEDNRKTTFVFVIILLMAAITALVVRIDPDKVLLVPLCIAPILMRIFFDMRVSLYIHLTTVIILGNLVPNSFEFIFYQLVTGMMSIITVKNFENRSKFFVVSLVIFITYSLIYTCGILSQDTHFENLRLERYMIFFLNAVLTLLSYPLIYLFEKMFGITTDLTLLEISSTNTPALRELSRKAPGTFQHSMQVANISEDLINEIGGHALLAKVGALYHDIGKTKAPLFFTENQNNGFNPHDELDYEDSASIITQHVRDGVDLARKYRLPAEVTDFIRTHHGTTYTGYFYAKQKQEHPDADIDISAFRYPGPMPYSRETAVVMIVDSVEAACKSLQNPNKESIDKLVDKIVIGKVEEGQLSNCDLTFGDLAKIRRILKDKMLSIYHVRIAYPTVNSES